MNTAEKMRILRALCRQADQALLGAWDQAEREHDDRILDLWVQYMQNIGPFQPAEEMAA